MLAKYKNLPDTLEESLLDKACTLIWDEFGEIIYPEYIQAAHKMVWESVPEIKQEPNYPSLNEEEISKLIYWVHRLYAEIPDKKENYELFDEVNASGVLMIDHFYDRLPKES